jgi:hypothetical protein
MFKSLNLTVNQWIIVFIILAIPIVNIVMIFIWAFGGESVTHRTLKNFSRAILKLSIICIGIFIAVVIGLGGKLPKSSVSVSKPITHVDLFNSNAESKISFNKVMYRTEYGITEISGETTNNDNKPHSYTFIVTFYDKKKNIVGTAEGVENNVSPGQTKTFDTVSQDSFKNVKSYRINIDTMIY